MGISSLQEHRILHVNNCASRNDRDRGALSFSDLKLLNEKMNGAGAGVGPCQLGRAGAAQFSSCPRSES